MSELFSYILTGAVFFLLLLFIYLFNLLRKLDLTNRENSQKLEFSFKDLFQANQLRIQEHISQGQLNNQDLITKIILRQMTDIREQLSHSFKQHASSLTAHLQSLNEEVRHQLFNLTQQVNNKLTEGFEKTSSTFIDVVARLTMIDEAQKKITELS